MLTCCLIAKIELTCMACISTSVEFRLRKTLSCFVKIRNLTLDLIIFIGLSVDTYFNSLFSALLWPLFSSKLKTSFAALKLS